MIEGANWRSELSGWVEEDRPSGEFKAVSEAS
jgi:hypothetical protein